MQVFNDTGSDSVKRDKFFANLPPDQPLVMVNLLKFKDKAEYPDGRQSDLSGMEAYGIYGQGVAKLIAQLVAAPTYIMLESRDVRRLQSGSDRML